MSDDETDEGYNEFIKEYGSKYEWDNKGNPEFISDLPGVRNPTSILHTFTQSDAFYLPQILNLIELPYNKFWYGLLLQGEDSIVDYYSKIKRCNDVIKFCKNHLREIFHKGLSSESQ
ncbi:12585_t:CDS:2, partial [Rhizophagus irregularis]